MIEKAVPAGSRRALVARWRSNSDPFRVSNRGLFFGTGVRTPVSCLLPLSVDLFTGVFPMTYRTPLAVVAAGLLFAHAAAGADWITAPSYYTHDPSTGERVTQYSPIGPFYTYARPDYLRSGYRHTRSSIQVGNSADNLHVVEEWGRPCGLTANGVFRIDPIRCRTRPGARPLPVRGFLATLPTRPRIPNPIPNPTPNPTPHQVWKVSLMGDNNRRLITTAAIRTTARVPASPGDRCNSPVGRDARIRGIPRTDPIAPILAGEILPHQVLHLRRGPVAVPPDFIPRAVLVVLRTAIEGITACHLLKGNDLVFRGSSCVYSATRHWPFSLTSVTRTKRGT